MMIRHSARPIGNRGTTLIEVMIALMIFAALALMFGASVPAARKAAAVNGEYAQALSLCQHKIDQCRAVGYGRLNFQELSDAEIIDDSNTTPYTFTGVDQVGSYLPNPTATLSIQYDTPGANQITVIATVRWHATTFESKTCTADLKAIVTNVE